MAASSRHSPPEPATANLLSELGGYNAGSDQLSQTAPDTQESLMTVVSAEPGPACPPLAAGEAAPDTDKNATSEIPELTHEQVDRAIGEIENLSDTPLNKFRIYLIDGGLQTLVDRGMTDEKIMKFFQDYAPVSDPGNFLKAVRKKISSNKRILKKTAIAALEGAQARGSKTDNKG